MEARPELKFCSMLSPVKKVSNNSARESAFIFGRSTSIFLAMSCFSCNSFVRQYRKLTHRADGKTSLLSVQAGWSHLEESLDVTPAQGLRCQQSVVLETFKVILKALHK